MKLVSLHADGRSHRTWLSAIDTPQASTYLIPTHSPVVESDGERWSSPYPVIAFFYPAAYFQVFMLLKATRTDYYCNVIVPPLFASDIFFIDLDLDVEIEAEQAHVRDVSEFSARRVHYPQNWGDSALAAVDTLLRFHTQNRGPFHPATADWWRGYLKMNQVSDA